MIHSYREGSTWDSAQVLEINALHMCYVRQCSLVLKIVLDFFKCLGFHMHFNFLYDTLSLHKCLSSGSLVFACLGGINKIVH